MIYQHHPGLFHDIKVKSVKETGDIVFPPEFHTQRYIKLQKVKWERIVGWIPAFDLKCSFCQIGKLSHVDDVNSDRVRMETEGISGALWAELASPYSNL